MKSGNLKPLVTPESVNITVKFAGFAYCVFGTIESSVLLLPLANKETSEQLLS